MRCKAQSAAMPGGIASICNAAERPVSCGQHRSDFSDSVDYGSETEFEGRAIERDLRSVAKDFPDVAFLLGATFASTHGDVDKALKMVAKARQLKASGVERVELNVLSNLGFASRALAQARAKMRPGQPDLSSMFGGAVAAGAIETVDRAINDANTAGQALSSIANEIIPLVRNAAAALRASGHTEDQLAAVLDVAGEVLREHRLLWLDDMPQVFVRMGTDDVAADSAPGLHYLYRVDLTPAEAAALGGEVGWRLVDLDLVFPALTVSVLGSKHLESLVE
jgi:hypothetical protein